MFPAKDSGAKSWDEKKNMHDSISNRNGEAAPKGKRKKHTVNLSECKIHIQNVEGHELKQEIRDKEMTLSF